MKRLLSLVFAAALSISAFGATLVPVQLLNPAGSVSGQAIVSTGPSSAPAWSSVNAATLGGATFAAPGPIGSTTPGSGAFTSLSASGAVSGTGFTSFVSAYLQSPSAIGSVTPAAAKFTTIQATGLIIPTSTVGIAGTATNDSPATGSVGELQSNSPSAISINSATATNCGSLPLTAGDWDVRGVILFTPAESTAMSGVAAGSNTMSATLPATQWITSINATLATGQTQVLVIPTRPLQLSSTTTVYAIGFAGFSGSTMTCTGWLNARRVR